MGQHPYPKSPGEEAMTQGEPRYGTCPVGQLLEVYPMNCSVTTGLQLTEDPLRS